MPPPPAFPNTSYFRPFFSHVFCLQVGNPGFAIVDEAYPYISKRLLTDDSPRLREALRYMVYGKSNVFDVERLIDLLQVCTFLCFVCAILCYRIIHF